MKRDLLILMVCISSIMAFFSSSLCYADTYIIQKGDTLWSIARKFYGDPNKYPLILQYNPNTMTHNLRPGDVIELGSINTQVPNSGSNVKLPVKERPRPFTWHKTYHVEDYQYIISVHDANGETFFTHAVPPVDSHYRDRRVNKKPNERKTLMEMEDENHPFSDCDWRINSKFHDDELYRLIRQQNSAIMSQLDALGDVTFKDMNVDGKEDMIITKGTYGALNMKFVDILLWNDEKQTFVKSKHPYLTSVSNVVFDESARTLTFAKQVCQTSWIYYKYKINEDSKFEFIEAVSESCSRHVKIGEIFEISFEQLEARPFICEFKISRTKEGKISKYDDDDGFGHVTYTLNQLDSYWQSYINGENHPKIFREKVLDYPTLYKRNHTLYFNSEEEMEAWKRENHIIEGLPF